ncbi:hypothetical protein KC865_02585 [Candidatus Kaiserbacteria bacterium]|nr:hypothetical protein [Candidatus Kaiserbacteria bacterium]USN91862.1 MAG: hypothetical protein H6782_03230 [Candidatus Nomurabacteria bacterium]
MDTYDEIESLLDEFEQCLLDGYGEDPIDPGRVSILFFFLKPVGELVGIGAEVVPHLQQRLEKLVGHDKDHILNQSNSRQTSYIGYLILADVLSLLPDVEISQPLSQLIEGAGATYFRDRIHLFRQRRV